MTEAIEDPLCALDQRIATLLRDGELHRDIAAKPGTNCSEVTRVRKLIGMPRGDGGRKKAVAYVSPDRPKRVHLHLAPMRPSESFRCEQFSCTLTARACVLRQGARYTLRVGTEGRGGDVAKEERVALEFKYCASGDCGQGTAVREALGDAKIEPPRPVDWHAQSEARRRAEKKSQLVFAGASDSEEQDEPAISPAERDEDEDGGTETEPGPDRALPESREPERPAFEPAASGDHHVDVRGHAVRGGAEGGPLRAEPDRNVLRQGDAVRRGRNPRSGDVALAAPRLAAKPKPPPKRSKADPLVAFERALRRLLVEATRALKRNTKIAKRARR